jgi:hypothetical protein
VQAHSEADELEKLAALRGRGISTDAEFEAKKADILTGCGPVLRPHQAAPSSNLITQAVRLDGLRLLYQ